MEYTIKNFNEKYLKYFVPLVGGQYYMGSNGNNIKFTYDIHQVFNFKNTDSSFSNFNIIKNIIFNSRTNNAYLKFLKKNKESYYLDKNVIKNFSNNPKEKLEKMLLALNTLVQKYNDIFDSTKIKEYFSELIGKLSDKNYYFLSGYNTHAVFVCKYKDMIIIGNVGGGIMRQDIDSDQMVKAIKYYRFKIEYLMILIFCNSFINEKLYIELIKKMNEDPIPDENKLANKDSNQSLKVLDYDVVLEKNHFYLKSQDKGTCTRSRSECGWI